MTPNLKLEPCVGSDSLRSLRHFRLRGMGSRLGQPLLSIPYLQELNDNPMIVGCRFNTKDFPEMIIDQFDRMPDQSRRQPVLMAIAWHPCIVAPRYRLCHLRRAPRRVAQPRDRSLVGVTTPGEIGQHMGGLR